MTKKLSLTYQWGWVIVWRLCKRWGHEEKRGYQKGTKMMRVYQILISALSVFFLVGFFTGLPAAAEENSCYLKSNTQDVFVIVYDMDREGNQGQQIWQGRINQGESVKITAPNGRFRYEFNAQPEEDQPLSGGKDRWCNNLNTILVP
jgi:hypothetical protein